MTSEPYPQDISKDDSALGFQRLLIDGIGDPMSGQIPVASVPVVAKILSSSDVLIKQFDLNGRIKYAHKRWGRDNRHTTLEHRGWYSIHPPNSDASQLIDNFKTGRVKGLFEDEIFGFQFHYRVA